MHFSQFGEKFMRPAGVTQMMSDLEDGIYSADTVMLGGGNPASIPEIEAYIAQQLATLQQQGEL
ncbi:valine--pyruvate transaminase, partial [Vibrio cholerae]|nr:valine--pyruvate transaminase [Vibrio cholerae]